MHDLISRKAAIDAVEKNACNTQRIMDAVNNLPPAQPDTTTHDSIPAETGGNYGDRTSGDCISRQQAVEAVVGCTNCGTEDVLRAYVTKHSLENGWTGGIVDALDAIELLPSAQPERKTGRWIPDNTDYYRTKFICSVCGESEEVPTTGFGYGTMWGYCPNCGADMKGDKHETN